MSGQPQSGPVVPRVRVTNLANVLTLLRLVLVPVFLLALFAGNGHETPSRIIAFVVFAVAVITDRFDGALARNYGMVTEFGTMADPIADKTLIGAALIGLSMLGDLHWWVTVVILTREVGITVLRFVMLRHGVIPASRGGETQDARPGRRDRLVRVAGIGDVADGRLGDDGGRDRADRGHRTGLRGFRRQGQPWTTRC